MSTEVYSKTTAKEQSRAPNERSFSAKSFDLSSISDYEGPLDCSTRLTSISFQGTLQSVLDEYLGLSLANSIENYSANEKFDDSEQFSHKLQENSLVLDQTLPNERAMYVSDWLAREQNLCANYYEPDKTKIGPCEEFHLGQVIGVRDSLANEAGRSADNHFQPFTYNKLKFEYVKLQKEHALLESHMKTIKSRFNHLFRRKNHDIDILKLLVAQTKRKYGSDDAIGHRSSTTLVSKDDLRTEIGELRNVNRRLQVGFDRSRSELQDLSDQLKLARSNPVNRKLVQIENENSQLKERIESDFKEFSGLKQKYSELEEQLRAILDEQRYTENEEVSRTMAKLNRIQIDQAKLKMNYNNELENKQELNRQLERLETEKTSLTEQLESYRIDLLLEKARTKKDESIEVEQLVAEVNKWRDKFQQMKSDKSGLEDSLRSLKLQRNLLDSSHQNEIELMRDLDRLELNKSSGIRLKLEEENRKLKLRLEEEEIRRGQLEVDNQKLGDEFLETKKQLEIVMIDKKKLEAVSSKLEESEGRLRALDDKVESLESNMKRMLNERSTNQEKLESCKKQVQEMRQTFRLQRKAYAESIDRKEKELVKLRAHRNLKQQSRQSALMGIKKELQSSLEELKVIKGRFSRQMMNDS